MILGKHSLHETRDLLAKTDYRFKQTQAAFQQLNAKVLADHAAGHDDDYTELNNIALAWSTLWPKWQADRQIFSHDLTTIALENSMFPISSDQIVAEKVWTPLVLYLQPADDFQAGTLPDIMRRMQNFGIVIDLSNDPKMDAADVDFQIFGVLDSTTKSMDAAAKVASDAAKKAASSNVGLLIGVGVGALIGTVVLTKIYL